MVSHIIAALLVVLIWSVLLLTYVVGRVGGGIIMAIDAQTEVLDDAGQTTEVPELP